MGSEFNTYVFKLQQLSGVFGTFRRHFCVFFSREEVCLIVNEELKKSNTAGEFMKEIDILSNSTDKRRKMIVQRLKNVLADIRSARRKLREIRNK